MKVVICSSLSFPKEILKAKAALEKMGHKTFIPPTTYDYLQGRRVKSGTVADLKAKKAVDAIRLFYNEIKKADAILVLNYNKKGVKNYIGPNSLIEIAFAHVLGKKIFLLNPVPNTDNKSEILHMKPKILNGNLDLIMKRFNKS